MCEDLSESCEYVWMFEERNVRKPIDLNIMDFGVERHICRHTFPRFTFTATCQHPIYCIVLTIFNTLTDLTPIRFRIIDLQLIVSNLDPMFSVSCQFRKGMLCF